VFIFYYIFRANFFVHTGMHYNLSISVLAQKGTTYIQYTTITVLQNQSRSWRKCRSSKMNF